ALAPVAVDRAEEDVLLATTRTHQQFDRRIAVELDRFAHQVGAGGTERLIDHDDDVVGVAEWCRLASRIGLRTGHPEILDIDVVVTHGLSLHTMHPTTKWSGAQVRPH